jgi:steroid delta-isomerase-like uncharacterized protein
MLENQLEENKAITQRYYEEISRGNLAILAEIVAPDILHHTTHSPEPVLGLPAVQKLAEAYHRAFPDLRYEIHQLIAEGDRVTIHWTASGHHRGAFNAIPPTGRFCRMSGITINRYADGKLVERWVLNDDLGMLRQMGVSRPFLALGVLPATLPRFLLNLLRRKR